MVLILLLTDIGISCLPLPPLAFVIGGIFFLLTKFKSCDISEKLAEGKTPREEHEDEH